MKNLHIVLFALVALVAGIAQADSHSDYRMEFVKKVAEPCILEVVRLDPDVRALYLPDEQVVVVGLAVAKPSVNRMVKATFPEVNGKRGSDRAKLFEQYLSDCIALNVGKSVAESVIQAE